jgi:hypothetical protein
MTKPECSTLEWFKKLDLENQEEVKYASDNEKMLGDTQMLEIRMWLADHVIELQEALAEVCAQEHSYHYSPPGYGGDDETAMDLKSFERLSEKFELSIV